MFLLLWLWVPVFDALMWGDSVAKPGVMIYFDIRKALDFLTDQQKGKLFQAILEYAERGIAPQFDGVLAMAWAFVQPQIDRDGERYSGKVEKSKYAVYVREAKKKGDDPITFDEWHCNQQSFDNNEISDDNRGYPTTTPTTTTTTDKDKNIRHKYGEYNNVLLSDEELEKLKQEIPNWEAMIERLSEYMASTGKKYKSHLATMRSWHRKDLKTENEKKTTSARFTAPMDIPGVTRL